MTKTTENKPCSTHVPPKPRTAAERRVVAAVAAVVDRWFPERGVMIFAPSDSAGDLIGRDVLALLKKRGVGFHVQERRTPLPISQDE